MKNLKIWQQNGIVWFATSGFCGTLMLALRIFS